jgi:uncharacterized protein YlxW (UPF0749 family)
MIEETSKTNWSEVIGYTTAGIAGLAFGIQKLIQKWKVTGAETSVVTLVHTELLRVAAQNKQLSDTVHTLQLEIINLNKSLIALSSENQRLDLQVAQLNMELASIRKELKRP